MSDPDSFLRAITADPDDDTARLVFADWLADHGDPDRGEFIRLSVELARRDPDDDAREARRSALFARRADLFKRHNQRWLEPFLPFAREAKFDRGFVSELEVAADVFLAHGADWLALAPIRRVRFTTFRVWDAATRGYAWNAEEFLTSPLLSRLELIDLERTRLTAADVAVLARHPDLSGLRELGLGWNEIGTDGAIALAGMAQLAGLESLTLVGNGIADAGARAIAQSPHLGGLKELWIDRNPIRKRTWTLLELRFDTALRG
ncbi:MAG: hypothetical protein JWO38_5852 [Gemmataceae bacterium]|nr:hypothetical protein [Gemmataceae bacterium]